jgi:hypothetical protein
MKIGTMMNLIAYIFIEDIRSNQDLKNIGKISILGKIPIVIQKIIIMTHTIKIEEIMGIFKDEIIMVSITLTRKVAVDWTV